MNDDERKGLYELVESFSDALREVLEEKYEIENKLNIISELIEVDTEEELRDYIEEVGQCVIFSDELLGKVYSVVLQNLVAWDRRGYEMYYQRLFKENIKKVIPNAEIIDKQVIDKNYPDAWVSIDGEEIPVEVKRNAFNKRALLQLQRYMNVYQKKRGIAVAATLTVELPDNIRFIPFDSFVEKKK